MQIGLNALPQENPHQDIVFIRSSLVSWKIKKQ